MVQKLIWGFCGFCVVLYGACIQIPSMEGLACLQDKDCGEGLRCLSHLCWRPGVELPDSGPDQHKEEECTPGQQRACYTGSKGCSPQGEIFQCTAPCQAGTRRCQEGRWSSCQGEIRPQPELCDGQDNDCDGKIDDFIQDCYTGTPRTQNVGQCKGGKQRCTDGVWGPCQGEQAPQTERCFDGQDNDCDGQIDNGCLLCSPQHETQVAPPGHGGAVLGVAFHPNGYWAASASADRTVRIWDLRTGKVLHTLEQHKQEVQDVVFRPNGKMVASASNDRLIHLWDVEKGKLLNTLKGHTSVVYSLAFRPDGLWLASASADKTVRLWDLEIGKVVHTLQDHQASVTAVAFSPDGKLVASASDDKTLKLWEATTGKLVQTLRGHSQGVEHIDFSPDGQRLASVSNDQTIRLWSVARGKEERLLRLPSSFRHIRSVAFAPDGRSLVLGADNAVLLWEAATGNVLRTFAGHTAPVQTTVYSPAGNLLLSGASDGTLRLWNAQQGRLLRTFAGHTNNTTALAFRPDGRFVVSGSVDRTLRLWELRQGHLSLQQVYSGHSAEITSLAFSPDGSLLASASADWTVRLWEMPVGRPGRTLYGHGDQVNSVAFSPDGTLLATASSDSLVHLWKVESGEVLHTLSTHTAKVNSVAFSPDGTLLATASDDQTIHLWSVETGKLQNTLRQHKKAVLTVAFSPKGGLLASASADWKIQLWELPGGKALDTLEGHTKEVTHLVFRPDGASLASTSEDQTIRLWEVSSGKVIRTFYAHPLRVLSLAYHPQGEVLLTGFSLGTIKMWSCPCQSSESRPCYTGLAGCVRQANGNYTCQGTCQAGTQTCSHEGTWQACQGQIIPRPELPRSKEDRNCNGRLTAGFFDLQLTSLTPSKTISAVGDSFEVEVCAVNSGSTESSAFAVRLYLSPNSRPSPADIALTGGGNLPQDLAFPALGVAQPPTCQSIKVTIPPVEAGSYSILALVDFSGKVDETDETNNLGVAQLKVEKP